MSRPTARLLAAIIALAVAAGCNSERRAIDRSDLPAFDATPAVIIVIDDTSIEPLAFEIESGVTFAIRNESSDGARFRGDLLDTGVLLPDEETLAVLDTVGVHEFEVTRSDDHDADSAADRVEITVNPSP